MVLTVALLPHSQIFIFSVLLRTLSSGVTDIILSRLRDLRHHLRCINSSLFCYDIPRVVGIFS